MNKDGTWDYMKEANALKEDADSLKALSNDFTERASLLVQRLDKQKPTEPEESTPNPPPAPR